MVKINYGANVKLTANANSEKGYAFVKWTYNNKDIDAQTTIEGVASVELNDNMLILKQVTANVSGIVAVFEKDQRQVDVNASADTQEGGTINIVESNE